MFLSSDFIKYIEEVLTQLVGNRFSLEKILPISGGDINDCYRIEGKDQSFFMKVNHATKFPNLFVLEREGLRLLKRVGGAAVPDVLTVGQFNDDAFLILAWIEKGERTKISQENLGRMVALLHKNTADAFGLDYDNYLGSIPQINKQHETWVGFFIAERLEKQLSRATDNGLIGEELLDKFEKLYPKLPDLFPVEQPTLLHGDLWNGNYVVGANSSVYLIDPAVYFGHREMDIALTSLFGGFDDAFYDAYQEINPLEKGWQSRLDLYNLYSLLFHANIFGGGYIKQVEAIANTYVE
ncbi:fructosamine kinase family protein [Olivibacter sp. SDN3]|uniref:fructosamine kinase family protein n=1 Tax=Olivibacter sp. SDN3 TaxID=2764720 RepID=UPI001651A839|nr:fructosamine kinase family protein [Olivibacter sp. SDN3]QNL48647.1 fructosamine kinase family protein [Olivibacter sp. SDN3]